jgi:hypothetical protein
VGPILQVGGQYYICPVHHEERGEAHRSIRSCPQTPKYRRDLGRPFSCPGVESGVDILTLQGEDSGLHAMQYHTVSSFDLPIYAWVGHGGLVHMDVVVITEVQKLLSGELSVIVSNVRIRYPEMKNDILGEIHGLSGTDFGQGLCLDPLSEFVYCVKQVA